MIRRFFCAILAIICLLGASARAADYSNLIRLHVVAEDDSQAAQDLKLALRDACLRCAEVCIGDADNPDEAYRRLNMHLDDFRRACAQRAAELGCDAQITAETSVFSFPDRIYGDVLVPAGEYRALRITVGEGRGHNWWCVLYPGLCMLDEGDYAGSDTVYYSKILRWIGDKIGGLR